MKGNAVGLCECGCGQKTAIATRNKRGYHKGEPMRFITRHHSIRTAPEIRFWPRVEKTDDGCWLWKGGTNDLGYGQFGLDPSKTVYVHIFSYELVNGPVPDGLVLDHLCRVHNCVRPDHLEPVTNQANILRGESPVAINSRKTHCLRGHPFDAVNTRWRTRPGHSYPERVCRQCSRDRRMAAYWKRKGVA